MKPVWVDDTLTPAASHASLGLPARAGRVFSTPAPYAMWVVAFSSKAVDHDGQK
jgi:hypothetical protein